MVDATFLKNRLQMIRRAAAGEPSAPRPAPAVKPSPALTKPRRQWGLVPCIPFGSSPTHRALPSHYFKTLRCWR